MLCVVPKTGVGLDLCPKNPEPRPLGKLPCHLVKGWARGRKGQTTLTKPTPAATPSLVRLLNKRNEAARSWLPRSSQLSSVLLSFCPSVHRPNQVRALGLGSFSTGPPSNERGWIRVRCCPLWPRYFYTKASMTTCCEWCQKLGWG